MIHLSLAHDCILLSSPFIHALCSCFHSAANSISSYLPPSYLTYPSHCITIQVVVTVLTINGPASPLPSFAVPYTNHSSAKCANATPNVQSVISYTAGLSMWYAPYRRMMELRAVQVPKVRALSGVTREGVVPA